MNRTIELEGRRYIIAPMTFGQGRQIFKPDGDAFESNCTMVAACLNNADGGTRTAADIEALPYSDGSTLMNACLDLNGLRATGEAEAAQTTAK